jgi:hypothetical protein
MLLTEDFKTVTKIQLENLSDLIAELRTIDWESEEFSRIEVALKNARLIEFPFIMTGVNETRKTHSHIVDMSEAILKTIEIHYPDCVFFRGEIAALRPGVSATLHRDRRWFHEYSHRLHVPLITNDQCKNRFDNREHHFDVGTLYEINNRIMHGAYNKGTETRVHCIVDVMPNEHYNRMVAEGINYRTITCDF